MPGKKGSPKSDFPQLRVTKETYDKLRKLRFKLERESMDEVISWLIEHSEKKL
jgi:predicted CopG family antitoxin